MNDFAYTICSHELRPDRRPRPMRGRFAIGIKTARSQATDHGSGSHLTIIKNLLGAIDSSSITSIAAYLGISTIQIAIAGGTG